MKLIIPPVAVLAVALISLVPSARAEVSPFRVRVEQANKNEIAKLAKTQKRSLKIFVSNASKESAELRAKYVFFGRDAKGNDIVKIEEGEKPVSVKGLSTEMVESAVATSTFEEAHSANASKGKAGPKVEASGTKMLGYGVQILQGEQVVAESYDPPSMKEQWSKAMPATKPPPVKK